MRTLFGNKGYQRECWCSRCGAMRPLYLPDCPVCIRLLRMRAPVDKREEMELPALDESVDPFKFNESVSDYFRAYVDCRERQLKAALSANREKDAQLAIAERDRDHQRTLYEEEKSLVDRIWKALGISTYTEAGGKSIDEIVASLRASVGGEKWISVKDLYPPDMTFVMVFAVGMNQLNGIQIVRFNQNEPASMFWHGIIMGHSKGVTHWQPLPAPPTLPTEKEK